MSKNFCILPWVHLSVDGMGNFYNCCFGFGATEPSKDSDGNVIKASDAGAIAAHWKSSYMQNLRSSFLNDERPEACIGCWRVEDSGARSFRPVANETYQVSVEERQSVQPKPVIKFVDLRFGNLCNLACRMCVPYSSLKLIDEFSQMHEGVNVEQYRKLDWYKSSHFWDELFEYLPGFQKIHLAGGEPLLIKECWNFLKRVSETPYAKNIILSYNTNLTKIPADAREVWSKFKSVDLIVSMDGVGKVNEFIRYPLVWSEFENNLLEIENHFRDYNVGNCQIQATLQAYNLMRLPEICDYVARFKNIRMIPLINSVWDPDYISPFSLPQNYREKAANGMDEYILKLKAGHNQLRDGDRDYLCTTLRGLSTLIRKENKEHLFKNFLRANEVYDKNRNQNFLEFIPELSEALK